MSYSYSIQLYRWHFVSVLHYVVPLRFVYRWTFIFQEYCLSSMVYPLPFICWQELGVGSSYHSLHLVYFYYLFFFFLLLIPQINLAGIQRTFLVFSSHMRCRGSNVIVRVFVPNTWGWASGVVIMLVVHASSHMSACDFHSVFRNCCFSQLAYTFYATVFPRPWLWSLHPWWLYLMPLVSLYRRLLACTDTLVCHRLKSFLIFGLLHSVVLGYFICFIVSSLFYCGFP